MSVRLLSMRLAKHARHLLQNYYKREIHNNILEQKRTRNPANYVPANVVRSTAVKGFRPNVLGDAIQAATTNAQTSGVVNKNLARTGIFRFGVHARKLFVDNILNRVTTTYSEKLRQEATKKLFFGDSAPFFALIGVSLASGAGVLTKEDELEGVCLEIREAANRLQSAWTHDEISDTLNSDFNIDKLNIGQAIAKGCAAVVYAANFKSDTQVPATNVMREEAIRPNQHRLSASRAEMMTPIQNISRFVHNFGGSVDNLHVSNELHALNEQLFLRMQNSAANADKKDEDMQQLSIPNVSSNAGNLQQNEQLQAASTSCIEQYPLALKMMFNYDIQSNALSILRAMFKETVPARQRFMHEAAEDWQNLLQNQTLVLPEHPNIVCMYGFFCDEVGNFPDGQALYPLAQPRRINPAGYGRNMSLYLLMKRYDSSLRALLDDEELSARSRLLLLAQLLEAVAHLNRHGIAHRDLKTDNILIEKNDDNSTPVLVISDFGCCLADKQHGLQIPYTSHDMDKGGNAALMAPEIINKQPGPFAMLNYEKADLWACGAMAYEIFGLPNPFYNYNNLSAGNANALRNNNYKAEQLPNLSDNCPALVQELIHNILNPNPAKRLSTDIAANVLQLLLWAPSKWLKCDGMPNSTEILQWLLSLTTKVLCEGSLKQINLMTLEQTASFKQSGRRTYVEYLLICSFLGRARLRRIRAALNWMHSVNV